MGKKETQQDIWGVGGTPKYLTKHCSTSRAIQGVSLRVTVQLHFSPTLTTIRLDLALKGEWMTFHWGLIVVMHHDPSTGSHIILHLIRSDKVQSASSIALISPSPPTPNPRSRCLPMYHSFPLALCSLHIAVADCSAPAPSVGQSASSVFQPEGSSVSGLWRRLTYCCSEAFSKQLPLKPTYQRPTCALINSTAVLFNESFLILASCKKYKTLSLV